METVEMTDPVKTMTCARLGKSAPEGEPKCLDPRAYCKDRTACPIHMLEKEHKRLGM